MGVRPGSTTIVEQNPFLQFVEAAWQDWKGEEAAWVDAAGNKRVSFVQALNLAGLDILDGEVARISAVRGRPSFSKPISDTSFSRTE
jgi:hypothetical protein